MEKKKKNFIHLFILLKQNKKKIRYVQIYLDLFGKKKTFTIFYIFYFIPSFCFFLKNKRILSLPRVGDKELNNNNNMRNIRFFND